jgi:hypothetical protein
MTLPRTATEVLSGHVRLEIRSVDRMLLLLRQPRLQYGAGIHGFFCRHRGWRFVSSALMRTMTESFTAELHHYIASRDLDLIHFKKDQRKDDVAKEYLADHDGTERILFVGRAQERTAVWRTRRRRDPDTGRTYPWLFKESAMVNHWYVYGFDRDFGPFFIKFCGYFPFSAQIYLNGHEYAMQQCRRAGIAFTAADNAFVAVADPDAVQAICDGMTSERISRFVGKWLARLPHPFTVADDEADYGWELTVQQIELATTQVLDTAAAGRIFFDQLIRDNLDIGRPDKVRIVFDRQIQRGRKKRTPGSFRTQVVTAGVDPYLYLYYKKTQVKQYLKQGVALRTETTINSPADFGIGKSLTHLPALRQVGYTANRRLLDVQRLSHDPATGLAALTALTQPVVSDTGTRIPALRYTDPRVQALLAVCVALALLPAGFTNRDLRHHLAPLLGLTPEAMTSGQTSYDLRRLRAHGFITRIEGTRHYRLTPTGLAHALFLTHLTKRFLIPGMAQITDPQPLPGSRLRAASRAYQTAIDDLARRADLAS